MEKESKIKQVAIQGISGSFHDIAAKRFFKDDLLEIIPSNSFSALIDFAQNGKGTSCGIMAIENSIAGSILPNYSLIRQSNLFITGELFLRVRQNLLALPGQKLTDLKEVHSHPMAIAQCHQFFKNYPKIKLVETEDTAISAKNVFENQLKQVGAIASLEAAEIYQLEILAESIETNKQNYTRFLLLEKKVSDSFRATYNKVSVAFSLSHEVGALQKVLQQLARQNANLTKIQSVPNPGQNWHYLFFIDFVLNHRDDFHSTIEAIKLNTESFQILGHYQTGKYYDD